MPHLFKERKRAIIAEAASISVALYVSFQSWINGGGGGGGRNGGLWRSANEAENIDLTPNYSWYQTKITPSTKNT